MPASPAPLTINWVDSESDIPADLWERCFPPPFEGRWWYQALEHCGIQDQFSFKYGVVVDQSGPVAIAPAFVMNVPIRLVLPPLLLPLANLVGRLVPSALYQRTFFIGSPCSDEGRVGVLPGVNRLDVYRCVNRSMRTQAEKFNAPMRVWKDFPPACEEVFSELKESEGLFPLVSFPGTIVRFTGATKEDYLASLKASRRNKLKKKLKIAADIPIDIEVLRQPDTHTLDEIFNLFWQTYSKNMTKFEKLNIKFFDLVGQYPCSHYIVLRERSTRSLVAFMLCFKLGDHVINKFIGIDYQKPKEWFLYFRLWAAAVDWSLAHGAKSIQSGQTGYAPKIEIGHELVPLTNYCAHS
ncbi:MAG: peptidogalycan biosysnthesis protein, partial [Sulfuricaulis sp.]